MRIVMFLVLLGVGSLRSLFPLRVQLLILRAEMPFANYVYWLGGGADDEVGEFMRHHRAAYQPFLLDRLMRPRPGSIAQHQALFHLIHFGPDAALLARLQQLARQAPEELRVKIEELMGKMRRRW
ncbi:MAG TPA: hypothetical protein VHO91_10190 [Rhodopila sp.]|nr:hypothetical protein [Rhodopila sp.]